MRKRAPEGRTAARTTEGLPSLAALGLAGGDGTEPADPLAGLPDWPGDHQLALTRDRSGPALPPGASPLTRLRRPCG
ncbi:hypothetical protein GCM10010383_29610 [Streptomyces lomondensis]|uniref:Uncharacterized protein n=1 Tax=Streptomyces lomondensis TaxID=68229 RepID=A0ABQ2X3N9_9ACTN|nr:hypothetical protein GCM10010383_29610 [Streptomyces lomondensis]